MRYIALVGVAILLIGSCSSSGGGPAEPGEDSTGLAIDVAVAVDVADPNEDTKEDTGQPPFHFEIQYDGDQHRGPVVLRFGSEGTDPSKTVVSAEWSFDGDDPWKPCTPLEGFQDADKYVWDSMADLQEDVSSIMLRLDMATDVGEHGFGDTEKFTIYNDPARIRQVLMTHDINGDDRVRQLTWTTGVGLGGVGDDLAGIVHTVGASPRRVAFSPNGKLAALVEEGSEHIRILQLDLETGSVSGEVSVPATGLYPVDVEFGGDGGDLYVVHSNPNPEGGVYRVPIRTAQGRALADLPLTQIHSQFQAGDLEILPDGRGLALLAADPTGNLDGIHLAILSRDGAVVGEVGIGPEGSTSRSVAASPDGQWLLVTYSNFFGAGDRVVLVSLDGAGVPLVLNDVAVGDPEEVAWTGDSLTALVTEAMDDEITGLALDGGALVKGTSFTLGLAERVAHTAWGPDRDTFLVTTVSANTGQSGLAVVTVGEGGVVTNTGTYELGTGNDKIPGDVAVQP